MSTEKIHDFTNNIEIVCRRERHDADLPASGVFDECYDNPTDLRQEDSTDDPTRQSRNQSESMMMKIPGRHETEIQ